MKKLLALMLILLLGLCAGCITDSDDDDDNGDTGSGGLNGGGGTAAEYFPISTAATWTFDETEEYDGETYTDTYVMYTNGTETYDGNTYTVLTDSYDSDVYFRIEDNIVYRYDYYDVYADAENTAKAAVMEKIESGELPWMNFGVGKGNTWTIQERTEQYDNSSYSISEKGKYLGTESVTVGAGTYSNCMKFQITSEYGYTPANGAKETFTYTETFWLAKGVGPVKIVTTDAERGVVYSTITHTLKSYVKNSADGGSGDDTDGDGDGTGNDGGGDSSAAGTHAFYPFKTGAVWNYTESMTDLQVDDTSTYTHTVTVLGTRVIDGKTYWEIDTDDQEVKAYTRVENGIMYAYGLGSVATKIADNAPAALKQAAAEVNPYEDETPVLNLNLSAGQSWDIMSYSFSEENSTVTMTWTGTYLGTESVTVSAGTFSNCMKYETTYTTTSEYNGFEYTSVITENIWLAEGVGMVRSYTVNTENYDRVYETDEQLTGYSIP